MLLYWKETLQLKHRYVCHQQYTDRSAYLDHCVLFAQVEVDFDFVEALNTGRISSPSFASTRQIFPEMDYAHGVLGR